MQGPISVQNCIAIQEVINKGSVMKSTFGRMLSENHSFAKLNLGDIRLEDEELKIPIKTQGQ